MIKVAVLYGGKSAEHEVSLLSAKNILAAIDKGKYHVAKIFIPKSGKINFAALTKFDVVFPVLHGPFGEDGTIQGFLKLAGIPFVGAGVLGSAIGMDKDVQKRLLRDAGIPTARFTANRTNPFGYPVFVKPANAGSSIGVTKVNNKKQLPAAISKAAKYDAKVLIEEAVAGRELECAVLGNEKPAASVIGEVISHHEFYDYDAKYLDESGARLIIPARLSKNLAAKAQEIALSAYKTLGCEGMARVDMFLTPAGKILINEINTIPGFTNSSMFPRLWEASGLTQSKLIDKLIALALERRK